VYLPGAVAEHAADPETYGVLHSLRGYRTDNRGLASGGVPYGYRCERIRYDA